METSVGAIDMPRDQERQHSSPTDGTCSINGFVYSYRFAERSTYGSATKVQTSCERDGTGMVESPFKSGLSDR